MQVCFVNTGKIHFDSESVQSKHVFTFNFFWICLLVVFDKGLMVLFLCGTPLCISCSFAGSKERKIPVPTENPLTGLFRFVSCPNYTYEVSTS